MNVSAVGRFGWISGAASAAMLLLFQGCDWFMDTPSSVSIKRRLYVNDRAANDSLPGDLVRAGVKFVLQPGRKYEISVEGTARSTDRLKVFHYDTDVPRLFGTLAAASDGLNEVFSVESDRSGAEFFMARLVAGEDGGAVPLPPHVSLQSSAINLADTLRLKLLFVRSIRTLPDTASKTAFARDLFDEMGAIFGGAGIALQGSYEIVEPKAAPMVYPFSNRLVPLPGKRAANHAHLYLVDSIAIVGTGSGLKGDLLGFAPREVVDLDYDPESRVVLSGRLADARSLAITAAHELGHFFGLRHTVSTLHDMLQDDDDSNIEDGFADTRFCRLDAALAKGTPSPPLPVTKYCLRVSADNSCARSSGCDLRNLMHPFDCGMDDQVEMTPEQIAFLKRNLGAYRH